MLNQAPAEDEDPVALARAQRIAARREQRAEKKRLRELAQLEKDRTLMREKLGREQNFTGLTYERAAHDWEEMMENIKQKELKQELEATWAEVNQSLDRKANLITRLTEDNMHAEEQYQRSSQKHCEFIDYAIGLYHLLCKSMRDLYDNEVDTMVGSFHKECVYKERVHKRHKSCFENLLHGTNTVTNDVLCSTEKDFLAEKEDFDNKSVEHREKLRDSVVKNMNGLYHQMQTAVAAIRNTSMTNERLTVYTGLVNRENKDSSGLENVRKATCKCQDQISKLQLELHQIELETMERLTQKKQEKEYFMECFLNLRTNYESDIKKDEEQLRLLVASTHKTITRLTNLERKGTLILGITSVCRKLQTEKEKVLPIPEHLFPANLPSIQIDESMDDITMLPQLELFWLKVGLVKTHNLELTEEKRTLTQENECRRNMIRKYCSAQKYNSIINSLRISPFPTAVIPEQEASHMKQIKRYGKNK